jgi:hypothetical protein
MAPSSGAYMLPPIPTLVSCPKCSKPFKAYDDVSGNTFGATFWSDGWVDAPMMPADKVVIICPHCRESVWRDDCPDGHPDYKPPERQPWEDSGHNYDEPYNRYWEFEAADRAGPKRFLRMLRSPIEKPERERYLRTQVWWAANHPYRKEPSQPPAWTGPEKLNMAMLAALLDDTDGRQLITKAEIMRELGRFQLAKSLLERVPRKDHRFATFVEELVDKGDSCVREIKAPGDGDITIYV